MATGPRRPVFYLGVLLTGFVLGGFLAGFLERWLPEGAPKEILTWAVTPEFGPVSANLLVLDFTLGPIGLHVSVLSLLGVLIAYLIARSLF